MKKDKSFKSLSIIFIFLLGFLATASVGAATDFSGDYSGSWHCEIHNGGGSIHINLTQNGAIVQGTLGLLNWQCNFDGWPIIGNATGDALSFKATGPCQGYNYSFEVSQAFLTSNHLAGRYQIYRDGLVFCSGPFDVTKPIVIPAHYNISASAGAGGQISPAGNISVSAGANQTFIIIPNPCARIVDVQVDGVSVGAINSYTFSNISANHTIIATFRKEARMPWLRLLLDD